jgi:NitT/TauT family transport system ATP-binding protein
MAKIAVNNLTKRYVSLDDPKRTILVLNDISLKISEGEFVTVFGPNGCGKTTFLKVLAGVEKFEGGNVLIDNKTPREARSGLIFQDYADSLMPWLNCLNNILFPYSLKCRKMSIGRGRDRIKTLLRELNIDLPLQNYPYQLSGGQQQLTAILRTLIYQPDVILMDEPFSSLDYQTRSFMQKILLDIWEHEKPTVVFVSHDIEEALFLADRLVLLSPLPARIIKLMEVNFARPRERSLYESNSFFRAKKECLRVLESAKN